MSDGEPELVGKREAAAQTPAAAGIAAVVDTNMPAMWRLAAAERGVPPAYARPPASEARRML